MVNVRFFAIFLILKFAIKVGIIWQRAKGGETGRVGEWESGRVGEWETGRVGEWETGRVGVLS
jgi:hypothetical protein